jgi:hypothetical protein
MTAMPTIGLPMCGTAVFPVVLLLAGLLIVALRVWPRVRTRMPAFAPMALAALAIAYGIVGLTAISGTRSYDRLREQYAFESMETRVPTPPSSSRTDMARLPEESLAAIETSLGDKRNRSRTDSLRELHENRLSEFTSAPGFGVARLIPPWAGLSGYPREAPYQPGTNPSSIRSNADLPLSATDEPDLVTVHQAGILDFVNPRGFGYIKDRAHVAGFLAHGFSESPKPTTRWAVERIDLIGLLLHPEPVAYVSERLPAMDEIRRAPTRQLDTFEVAGLESLRGGQMLSVAQTNGPPRMLGAIRSVRQCVGCHGGERADLLGAFSYTLRPVGQDK